MPDGTMSCDAVAIVLNLLLNATLKTVLTIIIVEMAVILCGLTI